MTRRVELVLCDGTGTLLGTVPPLTVATPWWPDVAPVVAAVREQHGIEVRVLRLLTASGTSEVMGGDVTYLAELVEPLPAGARLGPAPELDVEDVEDDERRAPYARPGGLDEILDWADGALAALGRPRTEPPEQVKTWNLSSVVRIPTAGGSVWCKTVPPFMAHEGIAIEMVAAVEPALVPRLLAREGATGTVLLDDVPGEDQWEAPEDRLVVMVRALVQLQADWSPRVLELLDVGLPDWRGAALTATLDALVARPSVRDSLDRHELASVDALVDGLPARFDALAACGLPDTLVHGDFHPGNWRWDGTSLVLLDWGDSGVGHPLLDATAFLPRVPDANRSAMAAAWAGAWRAEQPGSEPERALDLVLPIAALRQALVYQTFLDGIERSERCYHEGDVARWMRRALE